MDNIEISNIKDEISSLKESIRKIEERNLRVEQEKLWEQSLSRKLLNISTTYCVMCFVFWSIGVDKFFINSIVPTIGYYLSTLSWKGKRN